MKIGSKISLFYSFVTFSVIIVVIAAYSWMMFKRIDSLYDSYLIQKAYLTAEKHWEEDELDDQIYSEIKRKYEELLPEACEILLDADDRSSLCDTLHKYMNETDCDLLMNDSPVTFNYNDRRGVALYYPDNEGNFVVLVMADNRYGDDMQRSLLLMALLLLVLSCMAVFVLGRIYSTRILSPLQNLLKEMKLIRANDLSVRIAQTGNKDELDNLISSVNEMLNRIDMAFKSEKSFVNNASHELNNPLTAIQGECEIALIKRRSPQEYEESLLRISKESERMIELMRRLLFLSRTDSDIISDMPQLTDLKILLEEILSQFDGSEYDFISENGDWVISADSALIELALKNIIINARKYSKVPFKVQLVRVMDHINVIITDYGIGIPSQDLKNIFQPFYRAANARDFKGQGIGLSICYKIFSVYGAVISIDSVEGQYTQVKVVF